MNDIQRRIKKYIEGIQAGRIDWNEIVVKILRTDLKFFEYETPTTDRQVYFMLNQLIDILNLIRNKKLHGVPYEFADLLSMSIGYMSIFGNPASFISHRVAINSKVKGEKNIVEKYEARYQKYGKLTLDRLHEILDLHNDEDYFKEMTKKAKHGK